MSSFAGKKHTGKALARLLGGITLGGGATLPASLAIIPNPVAAETVIPGPITTSTAVMNTNARSHFIEYTPAVDTGNVRPFFFIEPTYTGTQDGGRGYSRVGTNRLAGTTRTGSGTVSLNQYPVNQEIFDTAAFFGAGKPVRLEVTPNFQHRILVGGVVAWTEDRKALSDFIPTATAVMLDIINGASVTNVKYGEWNTPMEVMAQYLDAKYVPEAFIRYTGTPVSYRVQVELSDGTVIVSSQPVAVTGSVKGNLVLKAANGIPKSARGLTVNIKWMEVDAQGNVIRTITKPQLMPDRAAMFCINLGSPGEGQDRMYKDLTYYGIGSLGTWRTPGNTTVTFNAATHSSAVNTNYFNAQGQIIALPTSLVRNIQRPNVSGATCKLEWRGYTITLGNDSAPAYARNRSAVTTDGNGVQSMTFDYDHGRAIENGNELTFTVSAIDSAVPEANRFIRCAEVGTVWNGEVWDAAFIERLKVYEAIRLMDAMGSNSELPWEKVWADHPRGDVYGRQTLGLPYEHIIELSNRTDRDVWINLPVFGDVDYSVGACRALVYGEGMIGGVKLNPARKAYVEMGNEWFNVFFGLYQYAPQRALNATPPRTTTAENAVGGGNDVVIREMGYHLNRHFAAIGAAMPTDRLIRVVGHNNQLNAFKQVTENLVAPFKLESANYEAMTCATYFGSGFNNSTTAGSPTLFTTDLDVLFERYDRAAEASVMETYNIKNLARSKAKLFVCYEGQGHYIQPNGGPTTDITMFNIFQNDDRQRAAIRRWGNLYAGQIGGPLFGYYQAGTADKGRVGSGSAYQFGQWGFLRGIGLEQDSVKYLGYQQAKADHAAVLP